ncbi:T7SS effector LXG polymorphic toxin [Ligilactobacillus acidipiscis]|uniref:T7SS effector LXG polymorphic toxin n=1 Tax=Ligilactobacillus acidipiscis TaxID=89059 RepID=UPI0023F9BC3D|nr:T7SS effector LXG polymorphic toxin [Ligilactobacillus acidipiscis]WEV56407.1 T7SS effector LXG polymorphic toxin [Ligilactobacillus acidipiscis]
MNFDFYILYEPLLTTYHDGAAYLLQQFDQEIQDFAETVHESSSSAVIDTTEVTRLAGKFTNLLQDYTDIETKANSTYASITDLVSVTKVSGAKFEQQMAKTKKVLSNTNKWMTEFNSKQGKTQAGFNEILSKQKAELASLNNAVVTNKSGQVSGIISVGAQKMYQMKDFKKSVKTGHAKVAKLEKSYDNHYHGMKYLWQEYSNTKVGKATSTLVNGKKAVDDYLDNSFIGDVKDRAVNAVSLSKELKNVKEILLGKAGKEGKYGKVGIKTYAELKTALSASKDYIKNGKIGKGIKQSIERIPTSVKDGAVRKVKNVGEFVKKVGKNDLVRRAGRGAKNASKVLLSFANPLKKVALKGGRKIAKAKMFSKIGKKIPVLAVADMSVNAGFSATKAYNDKDSLGYKDAGKSVIHAGVDQVKQAGPLEFAMAGSAIAGPIGATAGFAFGTLNAVAGIATPKLKKKFYGGIEKGIDKGYDKFVKKPFSRGLNSLKKSISFG